ncbi:hypothetical protein IWX50DRAFT_302670 [Phyllosticta citricarpa]|uniref:Uncharacterized protein n=1 Tax=Phyllosticta citricarpa TaxID=55181 RepID=A0ABR1LK40_9PEZI
MLMTAATCSGRLSIWTWTSNSCTPAQCLIFNSLLRSLWSFLFLRVSSHYFLSPFQRSVSLRLESFLASSISSWLTGWASAFCVFLNLRLFSRVSFPFAMRLSVAPTTLSCFCLLHILSSFAAPLLDNSVLFMPFQSSLRLSRAWVHLSRALFILLFLVAFAALGILSCSKGQDIISVGSDQIIIRSLRTVGWVVGPALTGRSSTFISTFFSSISIFALSFSSHADVKWPATYLGSLFEVHGWWGGPMHRLPGLLSFSVSIFGSFSSQLLVIPWRLEIRDLALRTSQFCLTNFSVTERLFSFENGKSIHLSRYSSASQNFSEQPSHSCICDLCFDVRVCELVTGCRVPGLLLVFVYWKAHPPGPGISSAFLSFHLVHSCFSGSAAHVDPPANTCRVDSRLRGNKVRIRKAGLSKLSRQEHWRYPRADSRFDIKTFGRIGCGT